MSKSGKGISGEDLLSAIQANMANPEFKNALSQMLGVRQPRERVVAYRSSYGNAYVSIREDVGNRKAYITLTKGQNGFGIHNREGKFSAALPYEVEMSKKGDIVTCTTTLSVQNDAERNLIQNFLNGKLNAAELPLAPQRGRKPKDSGNGQTQTVTPVTTSTAPVATTSTDEVDISKFTGQQIKLASALVKNGQAKTLEEALALAFPS